MNLEKVVFGFFVLLAATLNFGFFVGDISDPTLHNVYELYAAVVVNHETGHWLGLGHASCPGRGRPAPVMQQQSIGMQGCTPNAWPLDGELAGVRR